jgi:hypothetical protein
MDKHISERTPMESLCILKNSGKQRPNVVYCIQIF